MQGEEQGEDQWRHDNGSGCTAVVSYDRLCNGNEGPPGPHGAKDYAFTMQFTVTRVPA